MKKRARVTACSGHRGEQDHVRKPSYDRLAAMTPTTAPRVVHIASDTRIDLVTSLHRCDISAAWRSGDAFEGTEFACKIARPIRTSYGGSHQSRLSGPERVDIGKDRCSDIRRIGQRVRQRFLEACGQRLDPVPASAECRRLLCASELRFGSGERAHVRRDHVAQA